MEPEKKWWTSKTIWANVVGLATTLGASVLGGGEVAGVDLNGPNGVAIIALVNIALRWATDKKIIK